MNKNLIEFRKELNLTREQMAKKLHISKSYYEKLEYGDRQPSYRVLKTFNAVFAKSDIRKLFLH